MKNNIYTLIIPLLFLFSCHKAKDHFAANEVITSWNKMAVTLGDQHDQFMSFTGIRGLTMMHVAMNDALNAIELKYVPYAYNEKRPDADAAAACSQAAFDVLSAIYPKRIDTLQKELNKLLGIIPESASKKSGIDLGKESALAILELRKDDGYEANAPYTPRNTPGAYQYTPPFDFVWRPDLERNKAFVLQKPDMFRSVAPPALSSEQYGNELNEVKALGVAGSKARTADETNYAHWWAEFAEHAWNRIGRITARERKLPVHETARMFALINMTIYEIYLACMESKYYYDAWRPLTAIHNADKDNNPLTQPDTSWQPEVVTPPFPEYPSGHSAVTAACAAIVAHVYKTKNISFEMESTTALPQAKRRSFYNLDSAVNECARSRIMIGYHFRFSTEAGKEQGRKLAEYVIKNVFKPVAAN